MSLFGLVFGRSWSERMDRWHFTQEGTQPSDGRVEEGIYPEDDYI